MLICRFLVGLAASPPLANTGGVISDLWARDVSGPPMSVYGLSSTIGPPVSADSRFRLNTRFGLRSELMLRPALCSPVHSSQMGNIWAGFISQQKGWRWVFYIAILVSRSPSPPLLKQKKTVIDPESV